MNIYLYSRRARWCFLILIISAAAGFSYAAAKVWVAARWNASADPQKWFAAAQLEPGNAQYWEQLGRYRQRDLAQRDLSKAAAYLRRATEIGPRSARLWLELAALDEERGDFPEAGRAYKIAQSDFPVSPDVAWRYGSFLLRHGDLFAAFTKLKRALDNDPSLEESALAECWKAAPDSGLIADQVLPRKDAYYVRAIHYFLLQKQTNAALVMWRRRRELNPRAARIDPTDPAIDLVNELIAEGGISEAHKVWNEAMQRSNGPVEGNDDTSVVFNGGFEHDFLNGGFDWRALPVGGASYDFDGSVAHSGRRSLRITFDGTANINFQHIFQYVPVASHQRYRFLAYLRTEGISASSGIQFDIFDPRDPQELQVMTPVLSGTNPWKPMRIDFESGADTQVLEILLRRASGTEFDNHLRGIVWIDDVSLVSVTESAVRAAR